LTIVSITSRIGTATNTSTGRGNLSEQKWGIFIER
jgi:hypothetical protein